MHDDATKEAAVPATKAGGKGKRRFLLGSIRQRLFLLVLLTMVPFVASILYQFDKQKDASIEKSRHDARHVLERVVARQEAEIESTGMLLRSLAQFQMLREGRWEDCHAVFGSLQRGQDKYDNFAVIDRDGDIVCSAVPMQGPVNVTDRSWFKDLVARDGFSVGGVVTSRVDGRQTVALGYPVKAAGTDETRAYVVVGLNLSWLREVFARIVGESGLALLQLDKDDEVMVALPPDEAVLGKPASGLLAEEALRAHRAGEGAFVGTDGRERVQFFAPAGAGTDAGFMVAIGIDEASVVAGIDRDMEVLLLMGLIGLLLVLAIAMLVGTASLVRPSEKLLLALSRLGEGDFSQRLPVARLGGEFAALSAAFNESAARLGTSVALGTRQAVAIGRHETDREVASQVNRLIFRERDMGRVHEEACRILVEAGGFPLAWTGTVAPGSDEVSVTAVWGEEGVAPMEKNAVIKVPQAPEDPLRKLLRTGRHVICVPALEPACGSLVLEAGREKVRAVALFPMRQDGAVVGVWAMYASIPDAFGAGSVKLYSEITDDIGLAMRLSEAAQARAAAETKAAQAQRRFESFMDNDRISAVIEAADGTIAYANQTASGLLGTSPTGTLGRKASDFLPAEAAKAYAEENDRVIATGAVLQARTRPVPGRGGQRAWLYYKFPLHDAGGAPMVGSLAFDVTEERDALERLKEMEERENLARHALKYITYAAGATKGFPTTDISGEVMEMTGFPPEAFLSSPAFWSSRIHPDDVERAFGDLGKVLEKGGVTVEYRWQKADGTYVWMFDKCVVTRRPEGGMPGEIIGIMLDVSDRRAAEEREQEATALRNKFINVVSHQLRTPLSSFRWNLESILGGDYGELKESQREFLSALHGVSVEVIGRIGDMLTALDIEEGRVQLERRETAFDALADSVVETAKKRCAAAGIACSIKRPEAPLPAVSIDAGKMRTAIEKLVDNAVSYTQKGGSVEVEVSRTDGGSLRLSVKDTGVGIPQAEQKRIFERFYRASNASKMMPDASGLGLSIAKYFVTQHGGTIGFTSAEGKGSTFWFEIPLKPPGA